MAESERKKAYNEAYKKQNSVKFTIRFYKNDSREAEIFQSIPNKAEFLREAIRAYAEKNGINITNKPESE